MIVIFRSLAALQGSLLRFVDTVLFCLFLPDFLLCLSYVALYVDKALPQP